MDATIPFVQANHNSKRVEQTTPALSGHEQEFVILYPAALSDGALTQAVLSLYYLPPQFKLRVIADSPLHSELLLAGHDAVRGRITVHTEELQPGVSPRVNAVLHNEDAQVSVTSESAAPRVVISKTGKSPLETTGGSFTIAANSPEALASAMLRIAKAA